METIDTDILVSGGGIAGLAATLRLAAEGVRVACVDPLPAAAEGPDLRTTAFLMPAVETLTRAGAWQAMAQAATPLWTMRLVDAGGEARHVREDCPFDAREMGDRPFGFNVTNRAARRALVDAIAATPHARLIDGTTVTRVLRRTAEAVARLGDGRQVRARLVVAADGRDSALREAAGLGVRRWHYGQRALVFCVTHPAPHEGCSTEIHRTGGPLTLVPMPDIDGRPCSSVVWMVPNARADELAAMDDTRLCVEITAETMGIFGPLEVASPRAVWPIIGQLATRLWAERLALVAETAHVIPPIGAQGLNISLADIESLAGLVAAAHREGRDIGAPDLLSRYHRARWPEMAARVAGVDALNRFAQAEAQPVRDLRRLGLKAIHGIAPVRHLAMRLGMGMGNQRNKGNNLN
ncbi:FAD-dependent monooxygenase [Limibaculum sp. M0105]|uniref:FAD-dependent monooxygenase n=1 Tax=Thermohalobaculum xanthum TaxID=2753746 RepID=A0A8J7M8H4_9RHOB|nr:FAD-dependent oxidoreductase [Thermohalobaculum xanthum]MBK0399633.1 FAD-dependent monooxygenase [Thermohalobaculum xanthum]